MTVQTTTTNDHPATAEDRIPDDGFEFVVVANRLPVDRDVSVDPPVWRTSPGGLVTGLAPVMRAHDGAWVGWSGAADQEVDPFDSDEMHLVPVPLTAEEVSRYYEGFSNATLWPLYHDVIVHPEYHRTWWDAYVRVNERFARAAAGVAARGATVWVHDYQLQLVPEMLRALRPDVSIGFFNHIPFPGWEIFAQLPWRAQILRGLLGADLIGFQRPADAANFRRAVRIALGWTTKGSAVWVPAQEDSALTGAATGSPSMREGELTSAPASATARSAHAQAFPISIDTEELDSLVRSERIIARAAEIRRELGNPKVMLLGVDRMDYTKGIRHRLKAFGELLNDGSITADDVTLVQIATPSRERIEHYKRIRTDVEIMVGHINGEFSGLGNQAVHYLHHSYPRDEMAAFYLAADVMLVTALRDGMNLVAKEYIACRTDDDGVLVLSEFTGAAEQLAQAIMVNPYDIDQLKERILRAVQMPEAEQRKRMRALRKKLKNDDVHRWAGGFLEALAAVDADRPEPSGDEAV